MLYAFKFSLKKTKKWDSSPADRWSFATQKNLSIERGTLKEGAMHLMI